MNVDAAEGVGGRQDRHAVAGLLRPLSLRTRLSLLVGFIVAVVVGAAALLELRMFTTRMESELIGGARNTARAVADDFELRSRADDSAIESEVLHQYLEVNPAVHAITVIEVDDQGPKTVLSTSSEERRTAIEVAQRAITSGDEVDEPSGSNRFVAVPFVGPRGPMGVVVTVSIAAVGRVARDGGLLALYVMLPAVLVVTVLLDWLARRLVHRRIGGIRGTMQRVARGDLGARAVVERPDEIGAIVTGLNSMLAEMEELSESLQTRVREATFELRTRNSEVEEMYQRVFDLREALAKAEQLAAVGQAAANVAHQVGTPLNLVSGYVQVLLSDPALDTRTRRRLEMMQRQIEQVAGAVRGLLDRARRTVQRVQVEPAALIGRVLEIAQPRLDRNHVVVDVQAAPGLPRIEADAVQLELALLNLVTNAIDAMVEGGTLTVRLSPLGEGVRLEVGDSGPGVPDALLPTIFEPWVTTKPFGRGTGLGLAIARGVIGAHGGTIQAGNRPTGGALFTVDLPPTQFAATRPGPTDAPRLRSPSFGEVSP
jgi:two-component system, NtrC family, sensor kinase